MRIQYFALATIGAFGLAACQPAVDSSEEPAANDTDGAEATTATADADQTPCPFAATKDWKAWLDTMPPAPNTFIITGEAEVTTDGFAPSLTITGWDKMIPANANVELTLVESAEAKAGWQAVRLDSEESADDLGNVTIMCGGDEVYTGKIDIVS